ncbi:hypothetical protein [Gramella sp. MAR_2010_147]|nr:hypothetical protein [Gramella sp. MAR_2010_147]SDR80869.1 hypothetical protein SAMN04488553_0744 [Gramella sp. MAR_2010_147]
MKSLDSILQDFGNSKEGITHRRPFLNLKETNAYINSYNHRA